MGKETKATEEQAFKARVRSKLTSECNELLKQNNAVNAELASVRERLAYLESEKTRISARFDVCKTLIDEINGGAFDLASKPEEKQNGNSES